MADKVLSLSSMEKIMRAAGAPRVSEDSKEALRVALEEIGLRISKEASDLSRHAKRTTLRAEDIRLAARGK